MHTKHRKLAKNAILTVAERHGKTEAEVREAIQAALVQSRCPHLSPEDVILLALSSLPLPGPYGTEQKRIHAQALPISGGSRPSPTGVLG